MKKNNTLSFLIVCLSVSILLLSCNDKSQVNARVIFDSIVVNKQIPMLAQNDTTLPFADFNLKFVYPSKFGNNKENLTRLQQIFIGTFFNDVNLDSLSPQQAVEQYTANYTEEYTSLSNDYYFEKSKLPKNETPMWYWYTLSNSNEILFQNDSLLSYAVTYNDYTGGAHGSHFTTYTNVDLNSLTTISETDLFVPDYQKPLTELIIKKLMEQNNVSDRDSLIDLGFFDIEDISPNNNFRMDNTGIRYAYNQYEIAPYAMGVIEVYIPYSDLKEILIKDGIVSRFF